MELLQLLTFTYNSSCLDTASYSPFSFLDVTLPCRWTQCCLTRLRQHSNMRVMQSPTPKSFNAFLVIILPCNSIGKLHMLPLAAAQWRHHSHGALLRQRSTGQSDGDVVTLKCLVCEGCAVSLAHCLLLFKLN